MKPQVFIASSVEGLSVAYAVQENLDFDVDCTVWSQGVFTPSAYPLEDIVAQLEKSDFGVFVFSPEDAITIRKEEKKAVRDNVLFELGIFIGRLGRKRTFILQAKDDDLHIASDLTGIKPLDYNPDRAGGNLVAAIGAPCNQIRTAMKSQGPKNHTVDQVVAQLDEKCCKLMLLKGKFEYFPVPDLTEMESRVFDHASDRLKSLKLLRFDLASDGMTYAYHWTPLGRAVVTKFGYDKGTPSGQTPASGAVTPSATTSLTDKAQELLIKASGDGMVIKTITHMGFGLQVGNEQLCELGDARLQADWEAAYNELVAFKLVDDKGSGEVINLTSKGFKWADQLKGA